MDAHPVAADPLLGALLDGRYLIEALIAVGGMSAVYRGLDTRLDRGVAIKVIQSRYAGDQQFLARFQREARAVARLKHPGLVPVYDQGLDGQHPFLVMELVEGGTLRELLRERGPMPPHAVNAVIRPVLGGLAVAHRHGLVHRDIKPENVLISDDGDVKIADFGLVRALAEAKITSDSVILGTAAYLSPEQVRSGDAGPPSDVYAAGILIYELLTGVTPFNGGNALAVAYQRLDRDVPPPSTVIRGVPRQFDDLVRHATARCPADRYPDAQAMGEQLDAAADQLGLPDFQVPAPRSSAQHASGTPHRGQPAAVSAAQSTKPTNAGASRAPGQPHPTRQLMRGPEDWGQPSHQRPHQPTRQPALQPSTAEPPRQFAGVDLTEFAFQRQRARRMVLFWVAAVLIVTGMVAAAGWTLGTNVTGLI